MCYVSAFLLRNNKANIAYATSLFEEPPFSCFNAMYEQDLPAVQTFVFLSAVTNQMNLC